MDKRLTHYFSLGLVVIVAALAWYFIAVQNFNDDESSEGEVVYKRTLGTIAHAERLPDLMMRSLVYGESPDILSAKKQQSSGSASHTVVYTTTSSQEEVVMEYETYFDATGWSYEVREDSHVTVSRRSERISVVTKSSGELTEVSLTKLTIQ